MQPLSIPVVIDAVLRVIFAGEPSLGLVFTPEGVLIRLPTTRRIAEDLGVPHYYILPLIGALEANGDLTRAVRVGVQTTPAGTRRCFARIDAQYRAEMEALLGKDLYGLLVNLVG